MWSDKKLYLGYLKEQLYHPNKDDSFQELHPWISWSNLPIASASSTAETVHSLYNLELYIALYSSLVFLNFLILIIFNFLSLSFLLQEELFQFGGKLHHILCHFLKAILSKYMVVCIRIVSLGWDIWIINCQGVALRRRIRSCVLAWRSISLGVDFEVPKAQARPSGSYFLLLLDLNV